MSGVDPTVDHPDRGNNVVKIPATGSDKEVSQTEGQLTVFAAMPFDPIFDDVFLLDSLTPLSR